MQGQLFSQDFLLRGILETAPCRAFDNAALAAFTARLQGIYSGLDANSRINEAQTEALVITKVLAALGWEDDFLPQINLSGKRRQDVPDYLLFANAEKKAAAVQEASDERRTRHGLALLEAKRWLRPLDRGDSSEPTDPDAPSSQMLRYLSRADLVSDRAVKWGILSNGNVWRLYWQDARSRSEEFFEVDVAAALHLPGFELNPDDRIPGHPLRLFYLFFQRSAFLPQSWDDSQRSFHAYARNEARLYEERVSQDLGRRVFDDIFPQLANALARADPSSARSHSVGLDPFQRQQFDADYLEEVREATLVLLYRLLFLFYAEDRNLLPVRDERYAGYSVRRIRKQVRDTVDAGSKFSSTVSTIWLSLKGMFHLIDKGDDEIGMPAYNGGLFHAFRAPLLRRVCVPDKVMAPIIDTLSRRTEDAQKGWINYRDLSVSHLGSIYERLLEYSLVHMVQAKNSDQDLPEMDTIVAQPASFARKVSGSYYTHNDLVRLLLNESVGHLAKIRLARFQAHLAKNSQKHSFNPGNWEALDALDPASQILQLRVCDPAMGSGHFLVALVDYLADLVLEAINTATDSVNNMPWSLHLQAIGRPWTSPVVNRIRSIRHSIQTSAKEHGWAVTAEQLDDRHIVRRMILKKTVFGVDKNPMAVELAKTALWLHTFTVGAPLNFLDHHLKVGDSLHGEQLPQVGKGLQALGSLLLQKSVDQLALAAKNIAQVADLTDVDIAEANLSKQLATEADTQMAPLLAVMDFWRALRWLIPGWPVKQISQLPKLLKPVDGQDHPYVQALARILNPDANLITLLQEQRVPGTDAAANAANALIAEARALARQETFFHWWTVFPTVFSTLLAEGQEPGFDAVIGNPPWDRIKLQEVEWFAERDHRIAAQARAADRKKMIAALEQANMTPTAAHPPPRNLWAQYQQARTRAEANARVLGNGKQGSGDYPLLGGGDVNLYSLFVERAQSLINPEGVVAFVTPSGIAADKGAAEFFRSISSTGRLLALYDFENSKVFFPDVHSRFKFCALVFGKEPRYLPLESKTKNESETETDTPQPQPQPQPIPSRCAFFLHSTDELDQPGRVLSLSAADFVRVNPNTGAAPVFRSQRDADITLKLYASHPVLVRHGDVDNALGQQADTKVWPVKYQRMFDMTNDSDLFLKAEELQQQGWRRAPLNHWTKKNAVAVPLYEGKMVQMFDHRAADVVVNEANLKRAAQQEAIAPNEKSKATRYPVPQYWVNEAKVSPTWSGEWCIAYKSVTAPTNMRTMIAAVVPRSGVGNSMAMLLPEPGQESGYAHWGPLLLANLNAMAFDFAMRQKVQGQNLNWFIVEQAAVIAPERFDQPLPTAFAKAMRKAALMNGHHPNPTVADFVSPQVLALSYTAHDLAPFARDWGFVDDKGEVLPPLPWDETTRRQRQAGLDAVFFYLYGLDASEADYILSTFPIVREQDTKAYGHYRTRDEVLAYLTLLT